MLWFNVIILGAILIDIVCKFISVKECNDILEECKSWAHVCKEISSDATQIRIDISKSVATVDLMMDDCEDHLKASEAIMKGLAKDQHDIWDHLIATGEAVGILNKRLTNPRDLEPEWEPAKDTDDIPFYDTEEENYI